MSARLLESLDRQRESGFAAFGSRGERRPRRPEIELGLGIHGEPGVARIALEAVRDIVGTVKFPLDCKALDGIIESLVKAGKVVVDEEHNLRRTGVNLRYRRVKLAPESSDEPQ